MRPTNSHSLASPHPTGLGGFAPRTLWLALSMGLLLVSAGVLAFLACGCQATDKTVEVSGPTGPEGVPLPSAVANSQATASLFGVPPVSLQPVPAQAESAPASEGPQLTTPLSAVPANPFQSAESLTGTRPAPLSSATPANSGPAATAGIERCLHLLQQSQQTLDQSSTAQVTFHKRERLGGQLEDTNIMQMKVRRSPLAVYMRWQRPDEGREAIWQENANDNQILIHLGGWKGRLLPTIKVDPYGSRAAEGSRRPINTSGPWNFNQRMIQLVEAQRSHVESGLVVKTADDVTHIRRPCNRFIFEHAEPGPQREFHRLVIHIDRERILPVSLDMLSWPRTEGSGEPLLEESYVYETIELHAPLTDEDFNVRNPKYGYGTK